MKRALGLCLLCISWAAAASSEEYFWSDCESCCEWENWVEVETGYRNDRVHFRGPMRSPSANRFKKRVDADLWQINLQDRITWQNLLFLQIFGGFGYACHASDKAYMSVPQYSSGDATFDVAEPYANMGAASTDTQQGQISIPTATSGTTFNTYRHKRRGQAWSFDVALGTTFCCAPFAIEPRLGFTCEWLKINDSFRTRLDGGYIGLSLPFSFCNVAVFPDIAYIFAGQRNERIGIWNSVQDSTTYLSTHHGRVTGVKASVGVGYEVFCNFFVGFDWRFFYFRTRGGKLESLGDAVFWKPENHWTSNQFLGTITYNF